MSENRWQWASRIHLVANGSFISCFNKILYLGELIAFGADNLLGNHHMLFL